MDTLSHALWGKGLFGYRGYGKLALFFGAMPDLSSFGLLFIKKIDKNDACKRSNKAMRNIIVKKKPIRQSF